MQRAIVLLVLAAPVAAQNLVLNDDFERNASTGCNFNISNPDFNAQMPGCTAFGGAGELDIMEGGDCGYGLPAPSGSTKLGVAGSAVAVLITPAVGTPGPALPLVLLADGTGSADLEYGVVPAQALQLQVVDVSTRVVSRWILVGGGTELTSAPPFVPAD